MRSDEQSAQIAIRYNVTMDDLVAFNEYHMLLSPQALRKRRQLIAILTAVFVVEFGVVGTLARGLLPPGTGWWSWCLPPLFAFVFGGAAFFLVRRSFNRKKPKLPKWMQNRIRKLYSAGENKSIIGEHILEVSENGFNDRTAYNESRYTWGTLERIETTEEHTFLFIGALNAFVIPHNRITEGDLPAVLQAIKLHYKPLQRLDELTALPGYRG